MSTPFLDVTRLNKKKEAAASFLGLGDAVAFDQPTVLADFPIHLALAHRLVVPEAPVTVLKRVYPTFHFPRSSSCSFVTKVYQKFWDLSTL